MACSRCSTWRALAPHVARNHRRLGHHSGHDGPGAAGGRHARRGGGRGDHVVQRLGLDGDNRRAIADAAGVAVETVYSGFDTGLSLERVFERKVEGSVLDVLRVLYGPATYRKLVHEAGHLRAEYQRCIAEATLRMLGVDLSALDEF